MLRTCTANDIKFCTSKGSLDHLTRICFGISPKPSLIRKLSVLRCSIELIAKYTLPDAPFPKHHNFPETRGPIAIRTSVPSY